MSDTIDRARLRALADARALRDALRAAAAARKV